MSRLAELVEAWKKSRDAIGAQAAEGGFPAVEVVLDVHAAHFFGLGVLAVEQLARLATATESAAGGGKERLAQLEQDVERLKDAHTHVSRELTLSLRKLVRAQNALLGVRNHLPNVPQGLVRGTLGRLVSEGLAEEEGGSDAGSGDG